MAVPRGGWVYRSDENDYGLINAEAKTLAHIEVGTASSLKKWNWQRLFRRSVASISLLPPLMAMLALLAFSLNGNHLLSTALLSTEGACLIFGGSAVWWIRKNRWVLKMAVTSGMRIATDFQCVAQLLGEQTSEIFPSMTLWRAAQSEDHKIAFFPSEMLRRVKSELFDTYDRVRKEMEGHHREEKRIVKLTWISAGTILCCIIWALWSHSRSFELLAIWLPSAVGALHTSVWRRQVASRIGASRELLSELSFVKSKLMSLVPNDTLEPRGEAEHEMLRATLKMLCRVAAEHTQRELQFAIGEDPNVPI